ncbi:MAG: prepilin peptidase [Epsilonproteobacteria bacterium]|nr:prepilin peptidase [Campylobacterota bacterium]NPA89076.1 prepilin peptidase [Campylobacterota bacterium]
MDKWVIYLFVFVGGAIIGSFLNVVIYRVPRGLSIIYPSSRCPYCKTPIKPIYNIPLLGWLILKGKCKECSHPIPIRYPIIELIGGVLAVLVYWRSGELTIFTLIIFAIFATLLALSVIDLDYKAVPDSLNLLALTLSFFSSPAVIDNFINALLLVGGVSLLRFYTSFLVGRETLGEGDIIVAGTMGGLLGVKLALVAVVVGAGLALLPSLYHRLIKEEMELPFIPFLALGTFLVWLFQPQFLQLWSRLYG